MSVWSPRLGSNTCPMTLCAFLAGFRTPRWLEIHEYLSLQEALRLKEGLWGPGRRL